MKNKKKTYRKDTDWEEKVDKLKLKYNRSKDGYSKHKKGDNKSW
jgi:hypothetical protein